MANVFNIKDLSFNAASAANKAVALAGEMGLTNLLDGHVLPVLPPYPKDNPSLVKSVEEYDLPTVDYDTTQLFTIFGTPMCFPLQIRKNTDPDWWLLPTEPIISIGGSHELIIAYTAKASKKSLARGSIKQRWAQNDYKITIDGLLTKVDDWSYPKEDFRKLREILEHPGPIDVLCELFELLGIGRMAVLSFDFPFTKGEENQRFTITALSDHDWDLFIPLYNGMLDFVGKKVINS